ncbi:kinase-associated lipoprotein B [Oceanobacillus picturae]|uniref:kinase-associated lipoprotein B n=1 Tax=Oceanobacillus picturae TaxID=171693 RepID=UPI000E68EB3A|nr:kinase-associated lipoprotein B [Oceanobacillus picturae]RIU94648.1 kinase [Oceanobacillus picturae]
MTDKQIGDKVKAHYKSGTYLGKIVEDRGDKYLVEVLAVVKHPIQGDLHNPNQTEGIFFHERKALAFHEKMNVKKPAVHTFESDIPEYKISLQEAVHKYKEKLLQEDTAYNREALLAIERLEKEYA